MEETFLWPAEGVDLVAKDAGIAVNLRGQHGQIVPQIHRITESMAELEMVNDNPFLWRLTYFGRPMTRFDGGVLRIKIYISPRHPVEQPRVFFETPIFHIRVSPKGALIYLPARAEEMSRHIEGIITTLEDESPPYNPLMTVNPEATRLYWGSKEEQRLYNRKLRASISEATEWAIHIPFLNHVS
jgi:ubiquitin-conjugating enzyme E2 Z